MKSIIQNRVLAILPRKGIKKYNTFHLYAVGTLCVGSHTSWYITFNSKRVPMKSIIIRNTFGGTSFLRERNDFLPMNMLAMMDNNTSNNQPH